VQQIHAARPACSPSAESRDEADTIELLKESSKSIAWIATLGDGLLGKAGLDGKWQERRKPLTIVVLRTAPHVLLSSLSRSDLA
jgi:hypothetical protein